jgi:hypothetical protein
MFWEEQNCQILIEIDQFCKIVKIVKPKLQSNMLIINMAPSKILVNIHVMIITYWNILKL